MSSAMPPVTVGTVPGGIVVTPTPTAEPGYQTTEFWVSVVTQVIGLLILFHVIALSNDQIQSIVGLVALVGPAVGYAISRAVRKQGTQG